MLIGLFVFFLLILTLSEDNRILRSNNKGNLLAGANKHVVDDGQELHDSLVQVQILKSFE
jgi:hypothetical protein